VETVCHRASPIAPATVVARLALRSKAAVECNRRFQGGMQRIRKDQVTTVTEIGRARAEVEWLITGTHTQTLSPPSRVRLRFGRGAGSCGCVLRLDSGKAAHDVSSPVSAESRVAQRAILGHCAP